MGLAVPLLVLRPASERGPAVMLVPAGKGDPADILVTELSRGGNHPLYRRSLTAIDALFG